MKTIDIIIRSYAADFQLLEKLLQSIDEFLTGFRNVIVIIPEEDVERYYSEIAKFSYGATPSLRNKFCFRIRTPIHTTGYVDQQICKLTADTYSDADFFLHLDSDHCIVSPFDVQQFSNIWYFTRYANLDTNLTTGNPWQRAMQWCIGESPEFEYMRRSPYCLPRGLYAKARQALVDYHKLPFDEICKRIPPGTRSFSEFNLLGYVAHQEFLTTGSSYFEFVEETFEAPAFEFPWVCTLWSWGIKSKNQYEDIVALFRQGVEYLYNPPVYGVYNDTHFSKWVRKYGKLDFDEATFTRLAPYISPNSVIVEAGANIGVHTRRYCDWVGPSNVFAFEPGVEAFIALELNVPGVRAFNVALGEKSGRGTFLLRRNYGASSVRPFGPVPKSPRHYLNSYSVPIFPLDFFQLQKVTLLHLDIEGSEVAALRGAAQTIRKCRPVIWIEVNSICLEENGSSPEELIQLLHAYGYTTTGYDPQQVQQDILALPAGQGQTVC